MVQCFPNEDHWLLDRGSYGFGTDYLIGCVYHQIGSLVRLLSSGWALLFFHLTEEYARHVPVLR